MSKLKRFNLDLCMFSLLGAEFILFMWYSDVIPLGYLLTVGVCGMLFSFISKKLNGDEELEEVEVSVPQEYSLRKKIFIILETLLALTIGVSMVFLGVKEVSVIIMEYVLQSYILRYLLYGLLIPCLSTYTFVWCYSDLPPIHPINHKLFCGVLLGLLFIGLFVCIGWDLYDVFRLTALELKLF